VPWGSDVYQDINYRLPVFAGIIYENYCTVNRKMYIDVFRRLWDAVSRNALKN